MPIIIARSDAGLSPDRTAARADSYVPAGRTLAVAWIMADGESNLARVELAGPYTGPPGCTPLDTGAERYLNADRFEVPASAWRKPAASPDRLLPPEVAALNHHYESCRLQAYPDPDSGGEPVTIGWGSTFHRDGSPISWGERISQEEADALYEYNCYHKFWKKLEACIPHWNEMSDRQRASLCSFAYNNGADFYGGVNHETITRNLRERDWRSVPGTLMLYRNPGRPVEVGLGRRRRAEGLVWLGMEPQPAIRQAEAEIQTPADCVRLQQQLRDHPPPQAAAAQPAITPASSATSGRRLQDFLGTERRYSYEAIAADEVLATQIQVRLIDLGLLDPPTGAFGPISTAALQRFQELMDCGEPNFLGAVTAERLIETSIEQLPRPAVDLSADDLAARIVKYMQKKNYTIFTGLKEMNIVYVEGMDPDGQLNEDTPNHFNDLRLVIEFAAGRPRIAGCWEGTTEPGRCYTLHPMNPKGAARIKFGQYSAWRMGYHGTSNPHRALVQVKPITVHRDANKDFVRTGDNEETGVFAINQHCGYDLPRNDIQEASAGCLVGRTRAGHQEFLGILEQDPRFMASPVVDPIYPGDPPERNFLFTTTVIPGDDLQRTCPA